MISPHIMSFNIFTPKNDLDQKCVQDPGEWLAAILPYFDKLLENSTT